MKRPHVLALGAVLVGIIVAVGFFGVQRQETVIAPEGAPQIPDFEFPDADGNPVRLADVEATIRIVNFWASWSPYSKDELPALSRIQESYGDTVAVIALNRDTDPTEGRAFLESLKLEKPPLFAYDAGDTYFKKVGGFNMPETVFVDKKGNVLKHVHGPMTEEEIRTQLDQFLSQ